MAERGAHDLRWLSVSQLVETPSETVEFFLEGSLYAASVVLARNTSRNATEIRGVGKASLKALFKTIKSWEYDVCSKRSTCFEYQTEQSVGESKINRWSLDNRGLTNGFVKRVIVEPEQLLAVTELIFALEATLPSDRPIAVFFPIGDRVQAMKIENRDGRYLGRVTKFVGDLSVENYLDLEWPSKSQFEVDFHEGTRRIETIRLQLKPFGSIDLIRR